MQKNMDLMKKDITELDDIKHLVNTFYGKVRADELIGPIFNGIIEDRWPEHLEKMYGFWQTLLLNEHTYYGRPFMPHGKLPLYKHHFDRWLKLFGETMKDNFEGPKAEEALTRATSIAAMFESKIAFIRDNA